MFGLTRPNIQSYEDGTIPKLEKYFEITKYFKLDPVRFFELDMEKYTVDTDGTTPDDMDAENRSKLLDAWFRNDEMDIAQHQLDKLTFDELKAIHIKQYGAKQQLLRENFELKEKYIKLLEEKEA